MSTIITKNSSTPSAVPTPADLEQGELAVNVTDKRLFTENSGGSVVELGTNPTSITTGAITATGADIGNLTLGSGSITDSSGSITFGNENISTTGTFASGNITVTGNISVSGTVDGVDVSDAVTFSASDVSSASWFIDEDAMSSDSAVKVPSQQSVKTYVDNTVIAIGAVSVSPTPVANDYARFTSGSNLEGRSVSEVRADLSLEVGTDVQAYNAGLADISGLTPTDSSFIVGDGANWVAESGATVRASLGLVIGTDVQEEISGATLTSATVATNDKVLIQDADDSDNLKTVTAQSIADLATATFIDNYLSGLTLSNNGTDSDHDIDVAVGIAANSTNAEYLELASAFTKQIDATWASGTGNGGLASGATLGNNTWYHVFLIKVGGSVDVMFDTSVTCANGVANNSVTAFRRIGAVRTNGSANIHGFSQFGDRFTWDTPFADISDLAPGTTEQTYTLTVPTGVQVTAVCYATVRIDSAFSNFRFYETTQADAAASNTTNAWQVGQSSGQGIAQISLNILTNTSAQIHFRDSLEVDSVYLNTNAYIDTRGQ